MMCHRNQTQINLSVLVNNATNFMDTYANYETVPTFRFI